MELGRIRKEDMCQRHKDPTAAVNNCAAEFHQLVAMCDLKRRKGKPSSVRTMKNTIAQKSAPEEGHSIDAHSGNMQNNDTIRMTKK